MNSPDHPDKARAARKRPSIPNKIPVIEQKPYSRVPRPIVAEEVAKARAARASIRGIEDRSSDPGPIDFAAVNAAALAQLPKLCRGWLPDGRAEGDEWLARNPLRFDRHLGAFRINLQTGHWEDSASVPPGASGEDVISLVAYIACANNQAEAARRLAYLLGVGNAP